MADRHVIPSTKSGESFGSPQKYIHFLVFNLHLHTKRVKEKIDDLEYEDKGVKQVSRYLGMVERTLEAVQNEMNGKTCHTSRARKQTGNHIRALQVDDA